MALTLFKHLILAYNSTSHIYFSYIFKPSSLSNFFLFCIFLLLKLYLHVWKLDVLKYATRNKIIGYNPDS